MKTRVMFVACLLACGGSSKYPSRSEGCDVQVFQESPTIKVENIGHVSAHCDDIVSQTDCMRTLKDEVCRLGGDVVWGVPGEPAHENNQWKYVGRAAHTQQ